MKFYVIHVNLLLSYSQNPNFQKERKTYNGTSRLNFPMFRKNYNALDSLKSVVDSEDQRLHRLIFRANVPVDI